MKRELVEILACPVCRGKLELRVDEEEGGEIVAGVLRCPVCNHDYPIVGTIPDLMPPGD